MGNACSTDVLFDRPLIPRPLTPVPLLLAVAAAATDNKAAETSPETPTPPQSATTPTPTPPTKKEDEAFRAGRLRLAEAFLRLLAERREWVARSLAMAANATPTNMSGASAASPKAVTINNLLVNSLAHPELLGRFSRETPVRLRARAVAAARECQADGTFAPDFAQHFARVLGLGTVQEQQRRIAGMAVDKVNKKRQGSKATVVR